MFNFKKIAQELSQRTYKKVYDDFNKNVKELMNLLRKTDEDFSYEVNDFIRYNGLLSGFKHYDYYYIKHEYDLINNFIQTTFSNYNYLQNYKDEIQNYLKNLTSLLHEAKEFEDKLKNNINKLYNNFDSIFEQTLDYFFHFYLNNEDLASGSSLLFKLMNPPVLDESFKKSIIEYLKEYYRYDKMPSINIEFNYMEKIEKEFNEIISKNNKSNEDYEDFNKNDFYEKLIINLIESIK